MLRRRKPNPLNLLVNAIVGKLILPFSLLSIQEGRLFFIFDIVINGEREAQDAL